MATRKKAVLLSGITFIVVAVSVTFINSCTHAPYVMPVSQRTGDPNLCFERDVLPIFVSNCAKSGCHDGGSGSEGEDYVLNSYRGIVRRGIVPGNPAASRIWQSIAMNSFDVDHMPKDAPSLTSGQLSVIRRWIETGALDSGACAVTYCDTSNYTYSGAIAPMMQLYCIGCHSSASDPGGSLRDYNSVYAAAVNGRMIGNISHSPGYNAMPKGGIQLSDCQITQVKKWVAAGALNN
jgi:hypothetical protein